MITFDPSNAVLDVQQARSWGATVEQDKYTRVIACLRCQLDVSVITDNLGLKLSYDIDHWSKRCCCSHRSSPADCCSFL